MHIHYYVWLVPILVLAALVLPGALLAEDEPVAVPIAEPLIIECSPALVTRVVDGDTIDVLLDGQEYRVRYIGVNTPETVDPRRPVQHFGKEASIANKTMVEGREVCLERDISETDRYGRLLRYVWLDGYMVNAELVAQGYAQVSTYPPDVKYTDLFLQLQAEAQAAGRGMWAADLTTPPPMPETPVYPPGTQGNCHPSYPTLCLPPPPPDLDCKDIPQKGFPVLPPDPHRLDADRNGIGCER